MDKTTSKHNLRAFGMISGFVNDLLVAFPKHKNLGRYATLVNNLKPIDVDAVAALADGFRVFWRSYGDVFLKDDASLKTLHANTVIPYKKTVSLDIQNLVSTAPDAETLSAIRQHLVAICNSLYPDNPILKEAHKEVKTYSIDKTTPEYRYMIGAIVKLKAAWKETEGKIPSAKLDAVIGTRVVHDFLDNMHQGKFNKDALWPAVHSALSSAGFDMAGLMANMPINASMFGM